VPAQHIAPVAPQVVQMWFVPLVWQPRPSWQAKFGEVPQQFWLA
jgi:hypothetical protein